MNIEYLEKSAIKIMGYAYKTTAKDGQNFKDIPGFWTDYMQSGKMEKLHCEKNITGPAEYGLCISNSGSEEMEYIIGLETDGQKIPAGYVCAEIPPSKYAVFATDPSGEDNFTHNIQGLWAYIFSEWVKETKAGINENGLCFELYDETCMTKDRKVCRVFVPVLP